MKLLPIFALSFFSMSLSEYFTVVHITLNSVVRCSLNHVLQGIIADEHTFADLETNIKKFLSSEMPEEAQEFSLRFYDQQQRDFIIPQRSDRLDKFYQPRALCLTIHVVCDHAG